MRSALPSDLVGRVLDMAPFRYIVASCSGCAAATVWGHSVLGSRASSIDRLRFFPLGDRLLTWDVGHLVVVWDTATGKALWEERRRSRIRCADIFPDGSRVVLCTKDECAIRDASSGRVAGELRVEVPFGVDASAGNRVLTWNFDTAAVWDVASRRQVCVMSRSDATIEIMRPFPGGRRFTSSGVENQVVIWSADSCEALLEINHTAWVVDIAVLAGGDKLATLTSVGETAIWSAESGQMLRTWQPSRHRPLSLIGFPGDSRLAALYLSVAIVWNATSGEALHMLGTFPKRIEDMAISPGGDMLATCGKHHVHVWDAHTGVVLQELRETAAMGASVAEDSAAPEVDECLVAIGFGRVLDPCGFGRGVVARELRNR